MGSSVSVRQPYDHSTSETPDIDDTNTSMPGLGGSSGGANLPSWLRRSVAPTFPIHATSSSSSLTSSSLVNLPTQAEEKILPCKINLLNVPLFERHPFAEYRFQRKLGEGSFSIVYKGVLNSNDNFKVAIKEIDLKNLGKQQLDDLYVEMNLLSQLRHENIVQLYAVYSLPEQKFMIMEYLKGGELLAAICRREYYKESDARRVMLQVTSALHYMHARHVVHRDIKPMNLILAHRHSIEHAPVKIVDFGFATLDTEELRKPSRFLCGTPGYMAPEVIAQRRYSTKVDIWGLGVVFYIMISGCMPFTTDAAGEAKIMAGEYTFPPARFANVSAAAKDLISRMLIVDNTARISASEVLAHEWMNLPIPTPSASATALPNEAAGHQAIAALPSGVNISSSSQAKAVAAAAQAKAAQAIAEEQADQQTSQLAMQVGQAAISSIILSRTASATIQQQQQQQLQQHQQAEGSLGSLYQSGSRKPSNTQQGSHLHQHQPQQLNQLQMKPTGGSLQGGAKGSGTAGVGAADLDPYDVDISSNLESLRQYTASQTAYNNNTENLATRLWQGFRSLGGGGGGGGAGTAGGPATVPLTEEQQQQEELMNMALVQRMIEETTNALLAEDDTSREDVVMGMPQQQQRHMDMDRMAGAKTDR